MKVQHITKLHPNTPLEITYKKVPGKYKYELLNYYSFFVDIHPDEDIVHRYYNLHITGFCEIYPRYRWNGADWCPDTITVIRGSLEHDPLTQMYWNGAIRGRETIKTFNDMFKSTCKEDGMNRFQASFYRSILKIAWRKERKRSM